MCEYRRYSNCICRYISITVKYGYGQACVNIEGIKTNQRTHSIRAVLFHALRSIIMANQYAFRIVLMRNLEHNFTTKEHVFRAWWKLRKCLQYLQTHVINIALFEIVSKCRIPQTPSSC